MDGAVPDPVSMAHRRTSLRAFAVLLIVVLLLASPSLGLEPGRDVWPQFRGDDARTGFSPSTIPATNETLWSIDLPDQIQSSFAVAGTRALVGCDDGNLYCLDADTGAELWTYNTNNVVQSSPLVAGDRVYVGTADGEAVCLYLSNGSLAWAASSGFIVASPALWNGTVYFADQYGGLCALDTVTGEEVWKDTFPAELWASPTVVDGYLYVGDIAGYFRCCDAATGTVEWERHWEGADIYSSACVRDGRVLVGTGLHATLQCVDAASGDDVWTFNASKVIPEDGPEPRYYEVYSSPAVDRGVVYVHSWHWLWAIPWEDPDGSGEITDDEALWSFETGDIEGGSSPAISGERLVVGSTGETLYCLETGTGEVNWSLYMPGFVLASPALARDRVYVGSSAGRVVCVGQPGTPRLYTTLLPTATSVEGGQAITIDVTVLDGTGQPAGDAFMAYATSDGTLSATFGTVVNGEFRISWTAPEVSSTLTATITATGELPGWEVVETEIAITVEPAEELPPVDVPTVAQPVLTAGVVAFAVIDMLLAVVIVRGHKNGGKGVGP